MTAPAAPAPADTGRSAADVIEIVDDVRVHRLHHPVPERRYPVPVLLVPSLLSKWYVFDLHPRRSLAGYLRDHDFDVWIADMGRPNRKRPTPGFDAYMSYLAQIGDEIEEVSDGIPPSVLGYSLGGVLATVFASLHPLRTANLITLTTPIDFHRTGLVAAWSRYFPVDPFVDFWGNVPSWFYRTGFNLLAVPRAHLLWRAFGEDMKTAEGRSVVNAVRHWIGDGVPVAGELYRTLVSDCYKHNRLVKGQLAVGGRMVDLSDIRVPLLTITAMEDHLCPPGAAEALNAAVSSDDETSLEVPGGHLGAVIGSLAQHVLWTRLVDWLEGRSGHHPDAGEY